MKKYFQYTSVNLSNDSFACIDTTNVILDKPGEKLKHAVLHLAWIGCGNCELALCFKDLLKEFFSLLGVDIFLETLCHGKFSNINP